MKKLVSIALCLIMILSLSACGAAGGSGSDKPLVDPEFTLAKGLPQFVTYGTYTPSENDKVEGESLLWTYEGDANAEYQYFAGFKFKATQPTLLEEASADAAKYFPDANVDPVMCDTWHEAGDSEYAYYVVYEPEAKMYFQSWLFAKDDTIYQYVGGVSAVEYDLPAANTKFALPKWYALADAFHKDAVYTYDPSTIEFPFVNIYFDSKGFDFTAENLEKKWNVKDASVEEHIYHTNDDSEEIQGYIVEYKDEFNDQAFYEYQPVIDRGHVYLSIGFGTPDVEWEKNYHKAAIAALLFSFEDTEPAVLTDEEIFFGEGLPSQVLRGDYIAAPITVEWAKDFGMFANYVPVEGNDSFELALYRSPKNGLSLEDYLSGTIAFYGVEEQEPVIWEYDDFNPGDGCHYAYTAFFVDDYDGRSYFVRYYAFDDGDDMVLAEYLNAPKTVEFTDPNFKQVIPNGMVEQPLTDYDKSYGAVAKYDYVLEGEMPTITIYENKLEGATDIKGVAAKIASAFDTTVQYFYEGEASNGKVYPCVYLKFFETIDGVDYMEEELVTIIDDTVVNMEFRSPAGDDRDAVYVQTSAPMLIWGSGSFNK